MAFEDLYRRDQRSKINCLLFDLDDTLYPLSSGLAEKVLENIGDYMVEKLGIDRSEIADLCNLLYKNYGTTMAGLRAIGYSFNYDDYHSFVHGRLPYENLKPDPVLRHVLLSLPVRKLVFFFSFLKFDRKITNCLSTDQLSLLTESSIEIQIFTNADKVHAVKALSKLGLEDCFEGIICFETLNSPIEGESIVKESIFDIVNHSSAPSPGVELPRTPVVCKPSEYAIERALKIAKIDPQRTIFFDDSVRNIQAGKHVGLQTVLVGKSQRVKGADYALESIHNIREALPELREDAEKPEDVRYSGNVAIETPVTA